MKDKIRDYKIYKIDPGIYKMLFYTNYVYIILLLLAISKKYLIVFFIIMRLCIISYKNRFIHHLKVDN